MRKKIKLQELMEYFNKNNTILCQRETFEFNSKYKQLHKRITIAITITITITTTIAVEDGYAMDLSNVQRII